MKKTLGLVMALVMILTAASAFAAPSKTTSDLTTVTTLTTTTTTETTETAEQTTATTRNSNVTVIVTENDSEAVTALLTALDANNAIPEAAKAALPAGSTVTKVEEAVTMKIIGGTAEEDLIINLKSPTSFVGKTVAVLLGVLDNGTIAEWKCVEGTAKDDGSIDVRLSGTIQDWLNGREFIALVAD